MTDQADLNAESQTEEAATETVDETATVEGKESTEAAEGAPEKVADPKDSQITELQTKVREMDGRVGAERGQKILLNKIIKHLEQTEGAVDRDAIATAVGVDRKRLDGILDEKAADDSNAFIERCSIAERNLNAVKSVLKTTGQDANEIIQTYGTLLRVSETEREKFMSLPEDDLVAHMIEATTSKGSKVKRLRDANGDVLEALSTSEQRIAELEAENAELRKKQVGQKQQRVPLDGGSQPTPQVNLRPGESIYDRV